jgi:hypothetical protein
LETDDIGAILKFYFAQTEEVTGRESVELPHELSNDLKRFAAGGLSRKELEGISAKIAFNAQAIETLAREIKLQWDRYRPSS